MDEPDAERVGRADRLAPGEHRAGMFGADPSRETARTELDAEPQARHAKGRVGGCDTNGAGDQEIDPGAEILAVRESQGCERRMVERLQQLLDPDEPPEQLALALHLEIREVESGAEVVPVPRQHEQTRPVAVGLVHRREERLDEVGGQRVRFLRPVQRQQRDRPVVLDVEFHAHPARRARTSAERSQKFGSAKL
jgi:hypothetical protein